MRGWVNDSSRPRIHGRPRYKIWQAPSSEAFDLSSIGPGAEQFLRSPTDDVVKLLIGQPHGVAHYILGWSVAVRTRYRGMVENVIHLYRNGKDLRWENTAHDKLK